MLWSGHGPLEELGDLKRAPFFRDFKGKLLTLKPCGYNGQQFPEAVSCGGLCAEFPGCLPSPSAVVLGLVAEFSADIGREQTSARSILDALSDVYDVITQQLEE